jgi:hypothetical protein
LKEKLQPVKKPMLVLKSKEMPMPGITYHGVLYSSAAKSWLLLAQHVLGALKERLGKRSSSLPRGVARELQEHLVAALQDCKEKVPPPNARHVPYWLFRLSIEHAHHLPEIRADNHERHTFIQERLNAYLSTFERFDAPDFDPQILVEIERVFTHMREEANRVYDDRPRLTDCD